MARAEEARDEIPSHPDDVETPEERGEAQAAPAQESADTPAAGDGESAEPASASSDASGDDGEHEHEHWERHKRAHSEGGGVISVPETATPAPVEVIGSEDALEELPQRHKRRWRHYENPRGHQAQPDRADPGCEGRARHRGGGARRYLSLRRPLHGADAEHAKRRRHLAQDHRCLRTASASRRSRRNWKCRRGWGSSSARPAHRAPRPIKRDFEYLLRLWENVRDLTLKSTAPCLVYEEGNLIKRSIRDLYNKDIDEILVAGNGPARPRTSCACSCRAMPRTSSNIGSPGPLLY